MFSERTLSEIRERTDIVEVVGEYVSLRRSGSGFTGLCPFHGEKTASFNVHAQKQIFHCFGCHKGGSVFTFVMAIEGLSFPETVRKLARRAGVTIEETQTRAPAAPPPTRSPETERILAALEWAAKYFHYLLTEVPDYRPALEYAKSRNLGDATLKKFRVGVAPRGWSTLLQLLRKRGFTLDEIVAAGLAVPKDDSPGKAYDRFRYRLIFPIRDVEGSVLGFGGRLLEDDTQQPKYLNSPESPVFAKRSILYGMFENQRGIRLEGETVMVEGYMDVVGLSEAGVQNAVATMGTALTAEHCQKLRPIVRKVITVFDPDRAGVEAWRRSVHLFLDAGLLAKDLSLPDGMDPDDFVAREGAQKFRDLCSAAPHHITKLLKEIAGKGGLSESETAKWLTDLSPVLLATRNLPERAMIWDDISLVLRVSVASLRSLTEQALARSPKSGSTKPQSPKGAPRTGPAPALPTIDPVDQSYFRAALTSVPWFRECPPEEWREGLRTQRIREWLEAVSQSDATSVDAVFHRIVSEETDPRLASAASAALVGEGAEGLRPVAREEWEALRSRLAERTKELKIKALSAQVKLSERMDVQEALATLSRLNELRSR